MEHGQDGQRAMPFLGRRIAFFGGSFDPPHMGHITVARAARAALNLDTVLFAPVGAQPLKPQGSTAGFEDRVAMTRLAIASEPGLEVSLIDAPRPGDAPNYTLDTLERLRCELPAGAELFFLMGADSFFGLRHWHRAAEIPFAASLIVASRPGQTLKHLEAALPPGLMVSDRKDCRKNRTHLRTCQLDDTTGRRTLLYLLADLDFDISSSDMRAQLQGEIGKTRISGFLPPAVLDYIVSHRLYTGS
jgi:nicotinate-nucleotide adenylyltransferase